VREERGASASTSPASSSQHRARGTNDKDQHRGF
jgi:hypothetical protein